MESEFEGANKNNCFIILELPYYDKSLSDQDISKRLQDKRRTWNNTMHPRYASFEVYRDHYTVIQAIMMDPEKRARTAQTAGEYVSTQVREELRRFSSFQEIAEQQVQVIADKTGISKDVLLFIIPKNFNKKIRKVEGQAKKVEDPNPKPPRADEYESIHKSLRENFQLNSFYEFLRPEGSTEDYRKKPTTELLNLAQEKTKSLRYVPNQSLNTQRRNVAKKAEEAFADDASRENYDAYLLYSELKTIITSMKAQAPLVSYEFSPEMSNGFLEQLVAVYEGNQDKANATLRNIGLYEGILMGASKGTSNHFCPFCYKAIPGSVKICPQCGSALTIKCPKCGRENDATAEYCTNGKCKASFREYKRIRSRLMEARDLINGGYLTRAEIILLEARKGFPDMDGLAEVSQELDRKKAALGPQIKEIEKLRRERRYFAAQEKILETQKLFPGILEVERLEGERLIEEAKKLALQAEKAERAHKVEEVFSLCDQVMAVCADYPGIGAILLRYPPEPVSSVQVRVNHKSLDNTVSWTPSPSGGQVTYVVRRKENSAPVTIRDGEDLGTYTGTSCIDKRVKQGAGYYYSVFVVRRGISSRGVYHRDPVINYGEVSIKKVQAGNENVLITWNMIPAGTQVRIFRKEGRAPLRPEEGREIPYRGNSLVDEGLKNNVTYGYLLCLEYQAQGKKCLSEGAAVTATPVALSEPADLISFENIRNEIFEGSWSFHGEGSIEVFYSAQRIPYQYGDAENLSNVRSRLQQAQCVSRNKNGGRFTISANEVAYCILGTVNAGNVVFGESFLALKFQPVEIRETRMVGNDLHIIFDWPQNTRSLLMLYRTDKYPLSQEDENAQRRVYSLKSYQNTNSLVLQNMEPKKYYINIYAELHSDGNVAHSLLSQLVYDNTPLSNIYYTMAFSRKPFGPKELVFSFHGETDSFVLPELVIYSNVGSLPIFKDQARQELSIPSQMVHGCLKVTIPLKGLPRNTYLCPFFQDDDLYDRMKLIIDIGSSGIKDHKAT